MTKKSIIDDNLKLIRTCIECQFARLKEEWKKQYRDDFFQDIYLTLLAYDDDKFFDAYNNKHLNALITKMIVNNLYSQTSPFFKKYIKFNSRTEDINYLIKEEDNEE